METQLSTSAEPSTSNGDTILEVRDLKTYFPVRHGLLSRAKAWVKAVDGVSLSVPRGKTLGLVGESGCGKTTVGRTILRLIPATSGRVIFDGLDVFNLPRKELRALRRRMQIIFQDPIGSLNPRMNVSTIVGEALTVHGIARGRERNRRVGELLDRCGLSASHMNRYPHEFSGGQRQRIGIARALALNPQLIICDEPVSALDVSIQSQILNLLDDLQADMGLSYLFIAHNLAVIKHFSDRVAVMYLGKRNPKHPYTQALLSAIPQPDPENRRSRIVLGGEVPSPMNPPPGCAFHPRCPLAIDLCRAETPILTQHRGCEADHRAACHRSDEINPSILMEIMKNKKLTDIAGDRKG
ncbi:MAG: ABC transporter ATP-binding protein [Planctomycetota bacterium]|jgi:oligopeptide/dipeptide ABC transporter ATP-binding protein